MDAYIVGVGTTGFTKHPQRSFRDLAAEAVNDALSDVGAAANIGSAHFGNCAMGAWGQSNIRGQVALDPLMRDGTLPQGMPIINVEGGCATGSAALAGAVRDVASGAASVSLAVGVEKVLVPNDPVKTFALFMGGIDQLHPEEWKQFYAEAGPRSGQRFEPHPHRVMFLDVHAMHARHHMQTYGSTVEQLAQIASKNHGNAMHNPRAQYRFEVTVQAALDDRAVVDPFTRAMCSPLSDGAAAVVVGGAQWLAMQPTAVRDRAVRVRGIGMAGGCWRELHEPNVALHAAKQAYDQAGISASDVDLAEVHDATAFCELSATECLGLCEIGEGGSYAASGVTARDGTTPVNASGGLISKGHPLAATGLGMTHELVTQLRGEAGIRQISNANATVGVQHNAGGMVGFDEALAIVAVLERVR